ncbi:adoMet dependent proline di-methyltransferase domain-containing protein [Phthorimaea operculella]|nr:adoMet dependent proline di-methyltransferase domain-containing protein [Phthorimaea operculella]
MSRQPTFMLFCLLQIQKVCLTNEFISEESFYQAVKLFYSDKPANADTVVGNEVLSNVDLARSRQFMREIDLVEQNEQFADAALHFMQQNHRDKLGTMYKMKVQDFHPDTYYDVIWIQWLLMYLTDRDAISLLNRCRLALKPNGVIILKENVSAEKWFDAEEASMARTYEGLMVLVRAARLRVLRARVEVDLGAGEYEDILALALAPATPPAPAPTSNTTRDDGHRCFI